MKRILAFLLLLSSVICSPANAGLKAVTGNPGAVTVTGSFTSGNCVQFSSSSPGTPTVSDTGGACGGGGGGGITIGTTSIISGTDTRVLFDDAGKVGENSAFTFTKATGKLTSNTLNPIAVAGANVAGTDFTLGAGTSTGSANGGNLNLAVAIFGGAGSGVNALNTVLQISGIDGGSTFSQPPSTAGSPIAFTVNGGAHTTLTAGTEATDVNFNMNRTVQFTGGGGGLTLQRIFRIQAPTLSFTTPTTLTTAVTFDVNTATPGGNATITNSIGGRFNATNVGDVPLVAKGALGQTGNLQQWQNSVGSALAAVTSGGNFQVSSGNNFQFASRSVISSSADGSVTLQNNAGSGFTALNLGGTVASPTAVTINGTGGSGTNISGGNLTLIAGIGTSQGAPGTFAIQMAPQVAGSGSVANTPINIYSAVGTSATVGTYTYGDTTQVLTAQVHNFVMGSTTGNAGINFKNNAGTIVSQIVNTGAFFFARNSSLPAILMNSGGTNDLAIAQATTTAPARGAIGYVANASTASITEVIGWREVIASGASPYIRFITTPDTAQTASTESVGIQFGGNTSATTVTRQWATGTLASQREYSFLAPTLAGVGAMTITAASTVDIDQAPIQGTNVTITNPYAFTVGGPTAPLFSIGPSTLAGTAASSFVKVTGTLPSTITAATNAVNIQITGAGSSSFSQRGFNLDLLAGYTGGSNTNAGRFGNVSAGTSAALIGNGAPGGNIGNTASSTGTTTGYNFGLVGAANNGNLNAGVWGTSITAKNSATNIGGFFFALNTGTTPIEIGVAAILQGNTGDPTLASAAILVDNGATSDPVALFRVAGTTKVQIDSTGRVNIKNGANQRAGSGTLSGGTLTVANTSVTANTIVLLSDTTSGSLANVGSLTVVSTAGVGFVVTSTNVLDASTFSYILVEQF